MIRKKYPRFLREGSIDLDVVEGLAEYETRDVLAEPFSPVECHESEEVAAIRFTPTTIVGHEGGFYQAAVCSDTG